MKVMFLLGGLGNQFFQLNKFGRDAVYSDFFQNGFVLSLFKLTAHNSKLPVSTVPFFLNFLILPIVLLDFGLAFLGKPLFTHFDLRSIKSNPVFPLFFLGYFQDYGVRDREFLRQIFVDFLGIDADRLESCDVIAHVRRGDIVHLEHNDPESNIYGVLSPHYFDEIFSEFSDRDIQIISDDRSFCKLNFPSIRLADSSSLQEDLRLAFVCRVFVGSNSTLSYWISELRFDDAISILPDPFLRRRSVRIISNTLRRKAIWE